MLTPEDDLRHTLRPGPHARESLFYGVMLPEEELMVFLYTWVGGDGAAGSLVTVVTGQDERLAFAATDGVPLGDADFDDWSVGGLTVRHAEPLKAGTLTFASEEASVELRFEALHDAFAFSENEGGCPPFAADERFEQTCRFTGTLRLGEREIAIDATGQRDHSWGVRDWDTIQDWKWISCQSADVSLNVMLMHGRGETWTNGYVVKGDVLSPITNATARAGYDADFTQEHLDLFLLDEAGRSTHVLADRYAVFRFTASTMLLQEAGCQGTIDGEPGRMHFEAGWPQAYVERQAAQAAAAAG